MQISRKEEHRRVAEVQRRCRTTASVKVSEILRFRRPRRLHREKCMCTPAVVVAGRTGLVILRRINSISRARSITTMNMDTALLPQ